MRYSHFRLRQGEGLVAMQDDAADAEVCAAKVDGEIDALGSVRLLSFPKSAHLPSPCHLELL